MANFEETGASVGSMLPVTPVDEVLSKTPTAESVDNEFAALQLSDDTENNNGDTNDVELPDGIPPAESPLDPEPKNDEEKPASPEEIDSLRNLEASMESYFSDINYGSAYMEGANMDTFKAYQNACADYIYSCKKANEAIKNDKDYKSAIKYYKDCKKNLMKIKSEVNKINSTIGSAVIGVIVQLTITALKQTGIALMTIATGGIPGAIAGAVTGGSVGAAVGFTTGGAVLSPLGAIGTFIVHIEASIKVLLGAYESFKDKGVTPDMFNFYKARIISDLSSMEKYMDVCINNAKAKDKGKNFAESAYDSTMSDDEKAYLESGMYELNKLMSHAGISGNTSDTSDFYVAESVYNDFFDNGDEAFTESGDSEHNPNIDDDIKPIIKKLNDKGYKTIASCSGHPSARRKDDRYRDGVRYGKLYSTARVVFDKNYDLPDIPTGWTKKVMEEDDRVGIYVDPPRFKIIDGLPEKNYANWKRRYMRSLEKWADELPNVGETKETDVKEVLESVIYDISVDGMVGV